MNEVRTANPQFSIQHSASRQTETSSWSTPANVLRGCVAVFRDFSAVSMGFMRSQVLKSRLGHPDI
jgi:hypothetical protein